MGVVDKVEMTLPAKKEYARFLRLAVAGIASRMNFNVDSLEDLKIGLEEAYLLAINNPDQELFNVMFEVHEDRLEVMVTGLGATDGLDEELSLKFGFSILNSVMDEVEWIKADGTKNLRMVKIIQ